MRSSLPLLLALTTAATATTLTPLLAHRFFPQQVLSKGEPLPSVCSVDISGDQSTDLTCGDLCLPHSYTCCPDKLGGCPQDASCVKGDNGVYGCCADGGKCTGDGKVLSSATTKASTTTSKSSTSASETTTAGDSETTGDSKPTNTDADTTSAGPTPTGDKPADGTATPTGGAAVYVPGSMGVIGAVVAGLFVL